jgi:hypothetical protein
MSEPTAASALTAPLRRVVYLHVPPERRAAFIEFFQRRWGPHLRAAGARCAELWQCLDAPELILEVYAFDSAEAMRDAFGRVEPALRTEYETLLGEALETAVEDLFDAR